VSLPPPANCGLASERRKDTAGMLTMTVESVEELNMNRPDGETMTQLIIPTCPKK